MRATEFIIEDANTHTGIKPRKNHEQAMPAAHRVAGSKDKTYDLNRIMMMVACADGEMQPVVADQSWAGTSNTAHPYTKIESNMLKHAYAAAGVAWDDILKPNEKEESLESTDTNKASPVKAFKGYPR